MAKQNNKKQMSLDEAKKARYPSVVPVVLELQEKLAHEDDDERMKLFNKWLEKLKVIEKEMRHLEKMEILQDNLASKDKK